MDIRQLRRFVSVAELGSLNKAAEYLAVSQPSLTRSIQMMEETLDVQLFDRTARGIVLTRMGEELLPHARAILNERDRAIMAIQNLRGRGGETLSIGTEAAFATRRLPMALTEMARVSPEVRFVVQEGGLNQLLNQVREGSLTFVLGSRAPFLDMEGIEFEQLSTERASVLMRKDHPLLEHGPPTLETLAQGRWIVSDNAAVIEGWSQMFQRFDLPVPTIALRTSSLQLTKSCLLYGDYVSLGDHTTYHEEFVSGRILRFDLADPGYQRPAGLFRRADRRLSPAEKTFCRVLRAEADAAAPG